jgi:hypothetical protein
MAVPSAPPCFCGVPCKTNDYNGGAYFKCGTKLNYTSITALLKQAKGKNEKDRILQAMNLGCKMNLKKEDYISMDRRLFSIKPKNFPKCNHGLFAKIGISRSQKHNGRTFLSCPTQYPDVSCNYFEWSDNILPADTNPHHLQNQVPTHQVFPQVQDQPQQQQQQALTDQSFMNFLEQQNKNSLFLQQQPASANPSLF